MNNAYNVGKDLRNKLAGLAETHPQIGDVRGSGLFVGVDLVSNRESRLPDGELANRVVNRMKNSGVLVGLDGRATNVIKIRPPMCFNEEHSKILLSALVEALSTG